MALPDITIEVRGEVVFNGDSCEFFDGWKRSTFVSTDEELDSSFDVVLRPDRSVYFRNGETVHVAVLSAGVVVEEWDLVAKPSPLRSSTHRMILKSVRRSDAG
jgi:hypothetical protein